MMTALEFLKYSVCIILTLFIDIPKLNNYPIFYTSPHIIISKKICNHLIINNLFTNEYFILIYLYFNIYLYFLTINLKYYILINQYFI